MSKVYFRDWTQTILGGLMIVWFGGINVVTYLFAINNLTSTDWLSTIVMSYLTMLITSGALLFGLFLFFDGVLNPEFKSIKVGEVKEK